VIGLMGVGQDITGRKRARTNPAAGRRLAQSANEPNFGLPTTKIVSRSSTAPSSRAMVTRKRRSLGKTPHFLYSPNNTPGLCDHIFHSTRRGGWSGELTNRRKRTDEFPITLSTSPIMAKDGRLVGLVGVARDVSEAQAGGEADCGIFAAGLSPQVPRPRPSRPPGSSWRWPRNSLAGTRAMWICTTTRRTRSCRSSAVEHAGGRRVPVTSSTRQTRPPH